MKLKSLLVVLLGVLFCLEGLPTQAQVGLPVQAPHDTLKVLSWNIFMLPPLVWHTGKRRRAKALVTQFKQHAYDILIIQEAFHPAARRILGKGLRAEYPHRLGVVNRKRFSIKTNSGIWILSKRPVQQIKTIRYRSHHGFDNSMSRKGAILFETQHDGRTLQMVGTHLNAGGPLEVRLDQMAQIRDELLIPFRKEGVPQVVAGDMNTNFAKKEDYKRMLDTLEVQDPQPYGGVPFSADAVDNDMCDGGEDNRKIIDYIFYRPNGEAKFQIQNAIRQIRQPWAKCGKFKGKQDLSDHNSIEALIWFAH